jgi:hypothetical protein
LNARPSDVGAGTDHHPLFHRISFASYDEYEAVPGFDLVTGQGKLIASAFISSLPTQ